MILYELFLPYKLGVECILIVYLERLNSKKRHAIIYATINNRKR